MEKISLEDFIKEKQSKPKRCLVCEHPDIAAINKALAKGVPIKHLSEWSRKHTEYPFSGPTVARHRDGHNA